MPKYSKKFGVSWNITCSQIFPKYTVLKVIKMYKNFIFSKFKSRHCSFFYNFICKDFDPFSSISILTKPASRQGLEDSVLQAVNHLMPWVEFAPFQELSPDSLRPLRLFQNCSCKIRETNQLSLVVDVLF